MNEIDKALQLLGLSPGASQDEIKGAFRDLCKVWHPDRFSNEPRLQMKAQERQKEINAAYQLLRSVQSTFPTSVAEDRTKSTQARREKPQRAHINIKMVSIPGGTFKMGDAPWWAEEHPVHTVTVSGFEMSVFEITNAHYSKFLNDALKTGDITATSSSVKGSKGVFSGQEYIYLAGINEKYPVARCWIIYSNNTFNVASGHENWPVVYVTWYGAKAFALYYGFDLPTEAEWEYACRGGKQHEYGTDNGEVNNSKANFDSSGIGHPVAVGSYPANPFGLYDMSGNVWEWCHDWYGTYPSGSVNNPSGPFGAQNSFGHVCRGGSWSDYGFNAMSRGGYIYPEDDSSGFIGFRVVRRVSPQNY